MGKLRVFESFSGIGSQSIALRNINCDYDVVGISEVDKNYYNGRKFRNI